MFGPELGDEPLDDRVVHVHAAQGRVAGCGNDLEDALAHLHQGHVERPAAEVEHGDLPLALLVEPVGEGGGGWLIDQSQDLESRDLPGVLRSLPLVVVEVRRDRDDRLSDLLAEERLGVRPNLPEDHRGDFGRGVVLPLDAHPVVRAHLPLDLHDRLVGVQHGLPLRRFADEDAILREGHDGREHLPAVRAPFRARDDLGRSSFHVRGLGVRGSKVDSDYLRHGVHLRS